MGPHDVLIFVGGMIAGIVFGMSAFVLRCAWLAVREYRGTRVVTCPETRADAAVDVDTWHATTEAARCSTDLSLLSLKSCSRWPEREDCGQECVAQIQRDPEGSRVRMIVERWYAGKACVYCKKPIRADDGVDRWLGHGPALIDGKSVTVQWNELPPETLRSRLAESLPVCWSCHEAETFRREHPELVTDRPARARAR